jgi:hypothetical protein
VSELVNQCVQLDLLRSACVDPNAEIAINPQAIAQQATSFGIDTGPVESSFSLLTVAMNNVKLREHIGASLGSRLDPGAPPIPDEKKSQLRELLTWVYGDGEVAPRISDSREMTKLGKVVGSEIGLAALRNGATLALAEQTMDEDLPNAGRRLIKHLTYKVVLKFMSDQQPNPLVVSTKNI